MKEIEVKILGIDPEVIRQKMTTLGAKQTFKGELDAIYYDDISGKIKAAGDLLRLRKEGEKRVLTVKKHPGSDQDKVKQLDEYEIKVSNFETTRLMLTALGYQETMRIRKTREEYSLEHAKVVIDKYHERLEHIPPFIEIEAQEEEKLFEVVAQLGYSETDCKPWNSNGVIAYYADQAAS